MAKDGLGRLGVWIHYASLTPQLLGEVEELGYGTVWLGGSPPPDWDGLEAPLAATNSIVVGTSIVNVWATPPEQAVQGFHRFEDKFPGRYFLGIGAGHREHTGTYAKPYDALAAYLDVLEAGGVPRERRGLAALGPRVATLAATRSAGALPYLTVPEHTASLRELLGPDALIVTEHKAVLDEDTERARATARARVGFYLGLSNYVSNLRRFGFTDEDLTEPGSDRFVDAVVAHGSPEQVADGLTAHLRAGADQVAVQVLAENPLPALRTLAPLLAARAN
ncbi:LLM class F420-dependent oxidoreductase [Nocardia sp. NPDC088792]|uniref:LLM class F420-dependent oxidoreductase n=1 Tax=Nocardia sp. NPDC088792 TaxID=3364332 RepID=UPI00381E2023